MKLVATAEEKLNVFKDCLETGLPYFVDYGYKIDWKKGDYNTAHDTLVKGYPDGTFTIEDIQTQMLRMGYGLKFKNEEYPDHTVTLTLALIEKNWDKCPLNHIAPLVEGEYDANDADVVMQYLMLGSVVFG